MIYTDLIRIIHTDQVDLYGLYGSSWSVCWNYTYGSTHSPSNSAYLVYLRRRTNHRNNHHRPVTLSPRPKWHLFQQWKINTKGRKQRTKHGSVNEKSFEINLKRLSCVCKLVLRNLLVSPVLIEHTSQPLQIEGFPGKLNQEKNKLLKKLTSTYI